MNLNFATIGAYVGTYLKHDKGKKKFYIILISIEKEYKSNIIWHTDIFKIL